MFNTVFLIVLLTRNETTMKPEIFWGVPSSKHFINNYTLKTPRDQLVKKKG